MFDNAMRHRIDGCPTGMTGATLRSWRAGQLSAEQAGRIAAHVADCQSCQMALSQMDTQAAPARVAAGQSLIRRIPRSRLLVAGMAGVAAAIILASSIALTLGNSTSHAISVGPSPTSLAVATSTATAKHAETRMRCMESLPRADGLRGGRDDGKLGLDGTSA